ncbi:MAG: DUF4351 domain-containing protein, partial [Candidatus Sericytochromatia bacterium]|nr:DUF4351 domain-containing protein [Candidatus Sericytochromatia bacterium]
HEVLLELLRRAPGQLAPALMRYVPDLDPTLPVTCVDTSANEPLVVERRADLVMLVGDPTRPRLAVVTEVQLRVDPAKQTAWPQYVVAMRNRWKCDVLLLVIAPDPKVARWASQPIPIEVRGGSIRPLVLGSEEFPRMDLADLAGHPQATVLHALMHCRDRKDLPLFRQAMRDIRMLPRHDRFAYYRVLERYLFPSFLELPEVAMLPIELRHFQEWIDEARAEGEAKGEARGEARGKAEGSHAQLLRTITRLLGRRVALPGPEALVRMEALPLETLEQLAEDLLDFGSADDLEGWLARH